MAIEVKTVVTEVEGNGMKVEAGVEWDNLEYEGEDIQVQGHLLWSDSLISVTSLFRSCLTFSVPF